MIHWIHKSQLFVLSFLLASAHQYGKSHASAVLWMHFCESSLMDEKNGNNSVFFCFGELMMRLTGFLHNSRSEEVSDYMNLVVGDKIK
jgi:hypothetical protein